MAKRKAKAVKKNTKESQKEIEEEKTEEKIEQSTKDEQSTSNNNNVVIPKKSSLKTSTSPKKKVRFSKHNDQMEIEARESDPEEPESDYSRLMKMSILDNFDDDSSEDEDDDDEPVLTLTRPSRKIQTRSSKRQKVVKSKEDIPPAKSGLFGKKPEEQVEEQPSSLLELIKRKTNKDQKAKKYNIEYKQDASSLQELGYKFENEVLVDKDGKDSERSQMTFTGDGFVFIDQDHYKLVCELVAKEIQQRLVKKYKFVEVLLPLDEEENNNNNANNGKAKTTKKKTSPKKAKTESKDEEKKEETPKVNIFHSNDFYTNKDKLLCIFCGAGNVKAGQWSGSLCVNDSLNTGAVFQYVEKAQKEGFAVILMNSNEISKETIVEKKVPKKKSAPKKRKKNDEDKKEEEEAVETVIERIPIPGLDNEFKHVAYVWDHFINKVQPKHLVFIAHSYGGVLSSQLLEDRKKDVFDEKGQPIRLRALAFTDSVHKFNSHWSKPVKQFLKANSINFEQSKQPLNTKLKAKSGTNNVSAGTPIHELTSALCYEPLWEFVLERVK